MMRRVLTSLPVVVGLLLVATSWFWVWLVIRAVDASLGAVVRLVYGGA